MQGVLSAMRDDRRSVTSEAGFIVVAAMVVLLALTLVGIWAIRTSTLELDIAGSTQRAEKQLNVAEGAVAVEVGNVGFHTKTWYDVSDTSLMNHALVPSTQADFDPGGDTSAPLWSTAQLDDPSYQRNPENWPRQNLLGNNADNEFDYRYLVTYLNPGPPPKGYDMNLFDGYFYRIQGQAVENGNTGSLVIEMGGIGVGPKSGGSGG